jgi:uncharacterized repeat protein (TIGR04138 family)
MLNPMHPIAKLLSEDRRYTVEAYAFVLEALNYAHNVLDMGAEAPSESAGAAEEQGEEEESVGRHVSGQELCEAARRLAIEHYGYMAKTVLNSWGVKCTGDFGEIVYNLIRIGEMRKTRHDCREDFDEVYDFDEAFRQQFRIAPSE